METPKPETGLFDRFVEKYDTLQPLRIEMYHFYHKLAMDFVPFGPDDTFHLLELGCGTGTFLTGVLEKYPKAHCVAFDYSEEMLKYTAQKVKSHSNQVVFYQKDLNEGLPEGLGSFQIVSSFSTVHHLTHKNKARLFKQIYNMLEPGGWFFLMDAMSTHFDDDVFRLGKLRHRYRLEERFEQAGIDLQEEHRVETMKNRVVEDSPEKDRIAPYSLHLEWLREAGFRSIDPIWHLWMEHFLIVRK